MDSRHWILSTRRCDVAPTLIHFVDDSPSHTGLHRTLGLQQTPRAGTSGPLTPNHHSRRSNALPFSPMHNELPPPPSLGLQGLKHTRTLPYNIDWFLASTCGCLHSKRMLGGKAAVSAPWTAVTLQGLSASWPHRTIAVPRGFWSTCPYLCFWIAMLSIVIATVVHRFVFFWENVLWLVCFLRSGCKMLLGFMCWSSSSSSSQDTLWFGDAVRHLRKNRIQATSLVHRLVLEQGLSLCYDRLFTLVSWKLTGKDTTDKKKCDASKRLQAKSDNRLEHCEHLRPNEGCVNTCSNPQGLGEWLFGLCQIEKKTKNTWTTLTVCPSLPVPYANCYTSKVTLWGKDCSRILSIKKRNLPKSVWQTEGLIQYVRPSISDILLYQHGWALFLFESVVCVTSGLCSLLSLSHLSPAGPALFL